MNTAPGRHVLCRLDEIEDGAGRGFTLPDGREIFIVRQDAAVFGYLNVCPHQGTPLDWAPDTFISEDSGLILCATHGAQFRIEDGLCVSGPCAGDRLSPVPVAIEGDSVVIAAP
ncbi:MAG: Rieske (2Fe-2S) protein [Alphaproteobacteria bacterium]|nr:MAG: Rieske (2Fe-2S) protein [Alphaproteobacteria bacterium]